SMAWARPPLIAAAAAVAAFSLSAERATSTTPKPFRASSRAMASPMPWLAPVINAYPGSVELTGGKGLEVCAMKDDCDTGLGGWCGSPRPRSVPKRELLHQVLELVVERRGAVR